MLLELNSDSSLYKYPRWTEYTCLVIYSVMSKLKILAGLFSVCCMSMHLNQVFLLLRFLPKIPDPYGNKTHLRPMWYTPQSSILLRHLYLICDISIPFSTHIRDIKPEKLIFLFGAHLCVAVFSRARVEGVLHHRHGFCTWGKHPFS